MTENNYLRGEAITATPNPSRSDLDTLIAELTTLSRLETRTSEQNLRMAVLCELIPRTARLMDDDVRPGRIHK